MDLAVKLEPVLKALRYLAALVMAGAAGWLAMAVAPSISAMVEVEDKPRRFELVSSLPEAEPVGLAVSPDGRAAASILKDGELVVIDEEGRQRVRRQMDGAQFLAISEDARWMAVGGKTGASWWVRILDSEGEQVWRQNVQGELTALVMAPGGGSAYALMDNLRMYAFDVGERTRWRRLKMDYVARTAYYSEGADAILIATSDPRGYGVVDVDGRTRWWRPSPPGQFQLKSAARGQLIVALTNTLTPKAEIIFQALSPSGRILFDRRFDGFEPRVAVSADGQRFALSYRRKLTHQDKSVWERRVNVWDAEGNRLWEQGGLFYKPVLVGVVQNPFGVVVAEDFTLLSSLDAYGRLAWRGPSLESRIVRLEGDESWRLAWAVLENGTLEVWRFPR